MRDQPLIAHSSTRARRGSSPLFPASTTSIYLPLGFVVSGMLCFFAGAILLTVRPEILASYHYNQFVIATTHLFTLGWLSSVVVGAMYQLVPVALETTLFSQRLGRWHLVLHWVGVIGMVSMLWLWKMEEVALFGSIFALGVGLFAYNIGRTLSRIARWNVVAAAIASALGWLVLTVLFGLFIAATKSWSINLLAPLAQMHTHAHLGVIGFFILMMVGVSYKLVPMFTLSEISSPRRTRWSVALLNLGLATTAPAILFESRWKFVSTLVIAAGVACYSLELEAMIRARKRRPLDWGLKQFLTANRFLLPLTVLGVALAVPGLPLTVRTGQLENVYGFIALIGVLSFAIIGMLYKIVPFLVWFATYSSEIGRSKVPSLSDLYSSRLQAVGYWIFLGGLGVTGVAIMFGNERGARGGCLWIDASLALFALNMLRILRHLWRPTIEVFPMPSPTPRLKPA